MADPTGGLGGLGGPFWSTLFGAVVGSAVSGAVSWRLQTSSAKASRDAEKALRVERQEKDYRHDLSLAHSITFKMIGMLSGLAQVDQIASDAIERIGSKQDRNSWLLVTPIANRIPLYALDRDEQSFIASIKVSGLTGKVAEAFYLYNDFIFLIESYASQRREVLHRIAAGRVGRMDLGSDPLPGELMTYEPLIVPVRQLAYALLERAPVEKAMMQSLLQKLADECKRLYGNDFGNLVDVQPTTNT